MSKRRAAAVVPENYNAIECRQRKDGGRTAKGQTKERRKKERSKEGQRLTEG